LSKPMLTISEHYHKKHTSHNGMGDTYFTFLRDPLNNMAQKYNSFPKRHPLNPLHHG
jgi:hypothetical protein